MRRKVLVWLLVMVIFVVSGCQQKDTGEKDEQTVTVDPKEKEVTSEVPEESENKPEDKEGSEAEGETWRSHADKKNIHVGAAIMPEYLDEPVYAETLATHFNTITPENHMKWGFIHPEKDRYDFTGGDRIVDFAEVHDMAVRGHALVWHIENPSWLTEGDWTTEELEAILEDHIKTVVTHYKGRVYAWDVVNEMFENGNYRETLWYDAMGIDYIEKALVWAHEADPDALLYLNDYGVEDLGIKSNAFYNLVVELLDKGVPLDGVGFQFHLVNESPLDMISVYTNIKRFTDLGLEVDFTEIDVRIRQPIQETKLASQAEIYRELMELVVGMDLANNFTTWGFTDTYSWVPGFFEGYDASLPFDREYQRKPAYESALAVLAMNNFELDYEARIENLSDVRSVLPAFDINRFSKAPSLDGQLSEGEYDGTVVNSFMYNQLGSMDATYDPEDISGTWRIGYHDNVIYGLVERQDDITVTNHGTNYENDTVEVFYEYGTVFKQLRTIIGRDFEYQGGSLLKKAVWNEDGTLLEFAIEIPEKDLTGLTMGFNIAMADNDSSSETREVQLYPYYGHNTSWSGKDMANMVFEGDTPRPSEKLRLTLPVDVKPRLAPNTLDGADIGYEWMNSVLMPLGYNQLEEKDQRMPSKEDLDANYRLTHFEGKLYGIIYRQDDTVEEGDTITIACEGLEEWKVFEVHVGEDLTMDNFKCVWSPDKASAEFVLDLEGDSFIHNYSISTKDTDDKVLRYDLYPNYAYGLGYDQGNYLEMTLE